MNIAYGVPLDKFNTFGVRAIARYFTSADSVDDLREAFEWSQQHHTRTILLGGGSNILFTGDVDALVVSIGIKGLDIQQTGESQYTVYAGAGENWHGLVQWAVGRGLGGIENLSFIPGLVGAAPVQNIGAYGAEFRDVCSSVTAMHRATGLEHVFTAEECRFGYRNSIFKQQPDEWAVIGVSLVLDKKAPLKTGYGALENELEKLGISQPAYADIARLVESIRRKKLPLPEDLGSAGSFFKNPVVTKNIAEQLQAQYPKATVYPQNDGTVKLSAAWLLDQAGWKGKQNGNVGCYPLQPLVLVNYGTDNGKDIVAFSETIQADIAERFGITLEREVVTYP